MGRRRVGPRPWLGPRLCVRAARLEPRPQGRLAWARLSSRSLETGALLDLPERPADLALFDGRLGRWSAGDARPDAPTMAFF